MWLYVLIVEGRISRKIDFYILPMVGFFVLGVADYVCLQYRAFV